MGNAAPKSEFTEQQFQKNTEADAQLLQYRELDLFDVNRLSVIYTELLATGSISRRDAFVARKRRTIARKQADIQSLLQILECKIFRSKYLKYLQREVSFATDNLDSFGQVLHTRCEILERIHLAYVRMIKRQEVHGKKVKLSNSEKKALLLDILKGKSTLSLEVNYETVDEKHSQAKDEKHVVPSDQNANDSQSGSDPINERRSGSDTPERDFDAQVEKDFDQELYDLLCSELENLPELLGVTGLFSVLHPHEKIAHLAELVSTLPEADRKHDNIQEFVRELNMDGVSRPHDLQEALNRLNSLVDRANGDLNSLVDRANGDIKRVRDAIGGQTANERGRIEIPQGLLETLGIVTRNNLGDDHKDQDNETSGQPSSEEMKSDLSQPSETTQRIASSASSSSSSISVPVPISAPIAAPVSANADVDVNADADPGDVDDNLNSSAPSSPTVLPCISPGLIPLCSPEIRGTGDNQHRSGDVPSDLSLGASHASSGGASEAKAEPSFQSQSQNDAKSEPLLLPQEGQNDTKVEQLDTTVDQVTSSLLDELTAHQLSHMDGNFDQRLVDILAGAQDDPDPDHTLASFQAIGSSDDSDDDFDENGDHEIGYDSDSVGQEDEYVFDEDAAGYIFQGDEYQDEDEDEDEEYGQDPVNHNPVIFGSAYGAASTSSRPGNPSGITNDSKVNIGVDSQSNRIDQETPLPPRTHQKSKHIEDTEELKKRKNAQQKRILRCLRYFSSLRYELTDNDVNFKCLHLLCSLVDKATEYFIAKLDSSACSEGRKIDVSLVPTLRLISALQTDLFRKTVSSIDDQERWIFHSDALKEYLQHLLRKSLQVIETARSRLDNSAFDSDSILKLLWNSLLGQALPLALTTTYSFLFSSRFKQFGSELMGYLINVNQKLQTLISKLPSLQNILDATAEDSLLVPQNTVMVETPHRYWCSSEQTVTIPGADVLCVELDSRCATLKNCDFVNIYNAKGTSVGDTLHGRQWPDLPLIVSGNTLTFKLSVGDAPNAKQFRQAHPSHCFGYRALVTGLKLSWFGSSSSKTLQADIRHQISASYQARDSIRSALGQRTRSNILQAIGDITLTEDKQSVNFTPFRPFTVDEQQNEPAGQAEGPFSQHNSSGEELTPDSQKDGTDKAAKFHGKTDVKQDQPSTNNTDRPSFYLWNPEYHGTWLLDLHQSAAHIVGKCLRLALLTREDDISVPSTPSEANDKSYPNDLKAGTDYKTEKDQKMITSKRSSATNAHSNLAVTYTTADQAQTCWRETCFIKALMHKSQRGQHQAEENDEKAKEYLTNLVDASASSPAFKLYIVLRKLLCTRSAAERMGGAVVTTLTRAYVAVALHHTTLVYQLLSEQIDESNADSDSSSPLMKSLAIVFKSSQQFIRQMVRQRQIALGNCTNDEDRVLFSYQAFCEPILDRLLALLDTSTCTEELASSIKVSSLCEDLIQFALCEVPIASIVNQVDSMRQVLVSRVDALKYLKTVVTHSKQVSGLNEHTLRGVFGEIGDVFRSYGRYPIYRHLLGSPKGRSFLDDTDDLRYPQSMIADLKTSFESLVESLVDLIRSEVSDAVKAMAVNVLTSDIAAVDQEILLENQVFSLLSSTGQGSAITQIPTSLKQEEDDQAGNSLSQASRNSLLYLSSNYVLKLAELINGEVEKADTGRSLLINGIDACQQCLNTMAKARHQVIAAGVTDTTLVHSFSGARIKLVHDTAESHCLYHLSLIATFIRNLSHASISRLVSSNEKIFQNLIELLSSTVILNYSTTPRLQHLSLRLLDKILPHYSCDSFQDQLSFLIDSFPHDNTASHQLIHTLFITLGKCLVGSIPTEENSGGSPAQTMETDDVDAKVSAEEYDSEKQTASFTPLNWRTGIVQHALAQHLLRLLKRLLTKKGPWQAITKSVFSYHVDQLPTTLSSLATTAREHSELELTRTAEFEKLSIHRYLSKLTTKREKAKEQEKQRKPQQAFHQLPWNCGICTYLNTPSDTACQMCSTPKPASTEPGSSHDTQAQESEPESESSDDELDFGPCMPIGSGVSSQSLTSYWAMVACIAVLGGHSRSNIIPGSRAESITNSQASETGLVVSVDRDSGRVKMLFDHSPTRILECDISKLIPIKISSSSEKKNASFVEDVSPLTVIKSLSADGQFSDAFYRLCKTLIQSLLDENSREGQHVLQRKQFLQELKEQKMKNDRDDNDELSASPHDTSANDPFGFGFRAEAWSCPICTFINAMSVTACNMCGSPNPIQPTAATDTSAIAHHGDENEEKSQNEEEDFTFDDTAQNATSAQVLFHFVRGNLLLAFCQFMKEANWVKKTYQSGLFPLLLEISGRPTRLDDFHSISQLESIQSRLNELLQEAQTGIVRDSVRFKEQDNAGYFRYSPFSSLPVLIPTSGDIGSTESINFLDDALCRFTFQRTPSTPYSAVRSNHLIPNTLPSYYYEVRVVNKGDEQGVFEFNFAIGMHRFGKPLMGTPGSHNSFAYSGRLGDIHQTVSGAVINSNYGTPFTEGDVVGCGWNLRRQIVYFTKNGERIGLNAHAFDNVHSSGQFSPCVWIESEGAVLEFNFGQEPWAYNFEATLPRGYLDEAKRKAELAKNMTPAELKRRTEAENLRLLMGSHFPIELCELALEQSGDNSQRASNWLLDNGYRELERMSNETIRASQLREEERKLRLLGVRDSKNDDVDDKPDHDADVSSWLQGSQSDSASSSSSSSASSRDRTYASFVARLRARHVPSSSRSSHSRSVAQAYLNDQIENEIPVGVDEEQEEEDDISAADRYGNDNQQETSDVGRDAASHVAVEIDEIKVGQLLTVSKQAFNLLGLRRPSHQFPGPLFISTKPNKKNISSQDNDSKSDIPVTPTSEQKTPVNEVQDSGSQVDSHRLVACLGKTGVVINVNITSQTVQMLFSDVTTASRFTLLAPLIILSKPQRLWSDPCQGIYTRDDSADDKKEDLDDEWINVAAAFIRRESALTLRHVRTTVIQVIGVVDSCSSNADDLRLTLTDMGGPFAMIATLKLLGAEFLSNSTFNAPNEQNSFSSSSLDDGTHVLQAYQKKLAQFLQDEHKSLPGMKSLSQNSPVNSVSAQRLGQLRIQPSDYLDIRCTTEEDEKRSDLDLPADETIALSQLLVEETVCHLIQAVQHPIPIQTVQSKHPYKSHNDLRAQVHIKGATKLMVTFDERCHISSDLMTRLNFYRDEKMQDLMATYHGKNSRGPWSSFIVTGDQFWYKFSSGTNVDAWGYKFKVTPLNLRISDMQALSGLNVELGFWILNFLLTDAPEAVIARYFVDIFNVLVWYIEQSSHNSKSRGIQFLIRIFTYILRLHQKQEMEFEMTRAQLSTELQLLDHSKSSDDDDKNNSDQSTDQHKRKHNVVERLISNLPSVWIEYPDFHQLDSLRYKLEDALNESKQSCANREDQLQTRAVQGLVELLSTAQLVERALTQESPLRSLMPRSDTSSSTEGERKSIYQLAEEILSSSNISKLSAAEQIANDETAVPPDMSVLVLDADPDVVVDSLNDETQVNDKMEDLTTEKLTPVGALSSLSLEKKLRAKGSRDSCPDLVDISQLGLPLMRLTKATFGVLTDSKLTLDITSELSTHLKRCGYAFLFIPADDAASLRSIPAFAEDPAPNQDKKLRIEYEVFRRVWDCRAHAVQEEVVRINVIEEPISFTKSSSPILIQPDTPFFEKIGKFTRFSMDLTSRKHVLGQDQGFNELSAYDKPNEAHDGHDQKADLEKANKLRFMQTPYRLSSSYGLEAFRASVLHAHYYPLVGAKGLTFKQKARCSIPAPNLHLSAEFSVSFWIYITPKNKGSSSNHLRSIIHQGCSVLLEPNDAKRQGLRSLYTGRGGLAILLDSKESKIHASLYPTDSKIVLKSESIKLKQLTHVCLAVGRAHATLYVNGIDTAQIDISDPRYGYRGSTCNSPILIGKLPAGLHSCCKPFKCKEVGFDGVIKDVRFYPRELTEARILTEYKKILALPKFIVSSDKSSVRADKYAPLPVCIPRALLTQAAQGVTLVPIDPPDLLTSALPNKKTLSEAKKLLSSSSVSRDFDNENNSGLTPSAEASSISLTLSSVTDSSSPLFSPSLPPFVFQGSTDKPGYYERKIEWTPKMDVQIIRLFQLIAESLAKTDHNRVSRLPSLLHLAPFSHCVQMELRQQNLHAFSWINALPLALISSRFITICLLNSKVSQVLPYVDFTMASSSWSLAHRFGLMNWLIFLEIKGIPWNTILRETATHPHCYIRVNRPRALKAKEKGNDPDGHKSVFGQIYRQLHFVRPSQLRCPAGTRPWRVSYGGEGGVDAGGLYRDSLSHMCADLQSDSKTPTVPLFIPCPNRRTGVGENLDLFIPNVSSKSSLHLSMFAFVGKLMGMAMRGASVLNLDLPTIIWKPLVGEQIDMQDVVATDRLAFELCDRMQAVTDASEWKTQFADIKPVFQTVLSNGVAVEVIEGGASMPVTFENRHNYIDAVRQVKLSEFDTQISALRSGLSTIVPIHLLSLFTPRELEMMVCGKREIDIEYLKANTRVAPPYRMDDDHVEFLWEVLHSFSHDERQQFLRFVWGQSRLPYNPQDFQTKFQIIPPAIQATDEALPVSHTCFFQLELPRYSTRKILRNKLLYAITQCTSIDADADADDVNWDDE